MKRLLLVIGLILCWAGTATAQYTAVSGYVERGGGKVTVGGQPPTTTKWMATYPGATVTVYATGTTNLSTIYSNATGTFKANPFTADGTTAFWQFFVANGTYDVRFSGTGIMTPWTVSSIPVGSSGSSGSLGNGTTVIDATTMPGADFTAKFQNAITAISLTGSTGGRPSGGTIDLRGFANGVDVGNTLTQTIQEPQFTKVIWPAGYVYEASGVSVITAIGSHNTCDAYQTCYVVKLDTSKDLSPVFYDRGYDANGNMNGRSELDHIVSLFTTDSGSAMPITSVDGQTSSPTFSVTAVAAAVNGLTTYTTSWAPAPSQFQDIVSPTFSGLSSGNNGNLFCDAWTPTTITCFNPSGVAQASASGTMAVRQVTYHGTFTNTGWTAPLPASCAANACAGYEVEIFGHSASPGLNDGFYTVIASTGSTLTLNNYDANAGETLGASCGANCTTFLVARMAGSAFLNGQTQTAFVHHINLYGTDLGIKCLYQCTYNSYGDLSLLTNSGAFFMSDTLDITFTGQDVLGGYLGTPYSYGLWLKTGFVEASGAELTMENTPISFWNEGNHSRFGTMYIENDNPAGTNLAQLLSKPTNFGVQNTFQTGLKIIDYSGFPASNNYGDITTYQTVQNPPASVKLAGIPDPIGTTYAAASACSGSTSYQYRVWGLDFNGNSTNYVESDTTNNATLGATACTGSTPATNTVSAFNAWTGSTIGLHAVSICKYISGTWKSLALGVQQLTWIDDGTGDAGAGACTLPTRNSTSDLGVGGYVKVGTPPTDGTTAVCFDAGGYLSTGSCGAGGTYPVVATTVTLSAAQLKSFDGTSGTDVQLIPAPASGFYVAINEPPTLQYIAGTTPFTIAAADNIIQTIYSGSSGAGPACWYDQVTGIFDQATGQLVPLSPEGEYVTTSEANGAAVVMNIFGAAAHGLTLGNGHATITIFYRVLPVSI